MVRIHCIYIYMLVVQTIVFGVILFFGLVERFLKTRPNWIFFNVTSCCQRMSKYNGTESEQLLLRCYGCLLQFRLCIIRV